MCGQYLFTIIDLLGLRLFPRLFGMRPMDGHRAVRPIVDANEIRIGRLVGIVR